MKNNLNLFVEFRSDLVVNLAIEMPNEWERQKIASWTEPVQRDVTTIWECNGIIYSLETAARSGGLAD